MPLDLLPEVPNYDNVDDKTDIFGNAVRAIYKQMYKNITSVSPSLENDQPRSEHEPDSLNPQDKSSLPGTDQNTQKQKPAYDFAPKTERPQSNDRTSDVKMPQFENQNNSNMPVFDGAKVDQTQDPISRGVDVAQGNEDTFHALPIEKQEVVPPQDVAVVPHVPMPEFALSPIPKFMPAGVKNPMPRKDEKKPGDEGVDA